jgi:hypothetical protein
MMRKNRVLQRGVLFPVLCAFVVPLLEAGPVSAAGAGPGWLVKSVGLPTMFSGKESGEGYFVTVTNVGAVASSGTVVIKDTLPKGMTVEAVSHERAYEPGNEEGGESVPCTNTSVSVTCSYAQTVVPGGVIQFFVQVDASSDEVEPAPLNSVSVDEQGGSAAPVHTESWSGTNPNFVDGPPAGLGVASFVAGVFGPAGERDATAGAHPSTVTTAIAYNTVYDELSSGGPYVPAQEAKTQIVDLPSGFVGDALSAPECSEAALAAETCPADTRIGVIGVFKESLKAELYYIYNVVPEKGYPAQFGFNLFETVVMMRPRLLPSSEGYVLSVTVPATPRSQSVKVREVTVSFFGDPSRSDGGPVGEAFATNPGSCGGGPLTATLELDSWNDPGVWRSVAAPMFESSFLHGLSGCGSLQFDPTVAVAPETTEVDSPSGYEVDLRVPQSPNFEGDLATPDLKDAVVSFPAGVAVSPGAANGLVACPASGPNGIDLGNGDSPRENIVGEGEELAPDGLVHPTAGNCPLASQIGEVEATSPLLNETLEGHVFVAEPGCGGSGQPACTPESAEDGELFGVYLEVGSEASGIHVKLRGEVSVNPQTGQVTTRFDETPQVPFNELKLRLNGGARAPLANPQACGEATTTSDLTPSSTPYTPDATPFSTFVVTGCEGSPFNPGFLAGTVSTAAGVFSPFTLTLSRRDGEQDLGGLTVDLPEGLLGRIAGVVRCGEVEADVGDCPAGSRVGTVTASAGAGSAPFWQSGPVFLTGPYNGGPFGLSVVVPAKAGPYNLGNVVVRASVRVNPVTAAVSVVSDPLPLMVDGVPLRVQTVNVVVGKESDFTFNPTNCSQLAVTASVAGTGGTTASVSSPFAASGCAGLPFKPVFTASTQGKATKAQGASMDARLSFPAAAAGSSSPGVDANIASFKVELPKQLPSRNTTLQKACLAATFEANPAACPSASEIGTATAVSPVLSSPLAGPVYLVSYGGEKFPQLVMILQGEGVTVDVTGTIFVSKAGITSVTLRTVPDAPISSFELKTPKGPFSILTSFVPAKREFSLCGQTLRMPTTITAQNGAVVKQDTPVKIEGCQTVKKKKKKAKAKKAARKAGRGGDDTASRGGRS